MKLGRDRWEAVLIVLLVLCVVAKAVCVLWIMAEM